MNSQNNQIPSPTSQSQTESIPQLKRTIHPDSLKFMGMAKELLDSPAIVQAIASEKDKEQSHD